MTNDFRPIPQDKLNYYTVYAQVGEHSDAMVVKDNTTGHFELYTPSGIRRRWDNAFDCAYSLRRMNDSEEIRISIVDINAIEQAGRGELSRRVANSEEWIDPIVLPYGERYERVINYAFGGKHHVRNYKEHKNILIAYAEFTVYSGLATVDFDKLTRLVVASHLYGVRAEIEQCNMQQLKIFLHARNKRHGSLRQRHPDALELISTIVDKARKATLL